MQRTWALVLMTACGPAVWEGDPPPGWQADVRPDLEASIADADGNPLPGSWVTLSPGGRDAQSADDGLAFFAGVPVGTYTVVVAADGFETLEETIGVTSDGASVSFALDPIDSAATLSGRVSDAAGSRVIGARVVLDGAQIATTDVDGQFEVGDLVAGRHTLEIDAPGSPAGSWSTDVLDLSAGIDVSVDVSLPGTIPSTSDPIGSETCGVCHPSELAAWSETAHAQSSRLPADLADHPMAEAFDAGATLYPFEDYPDTYVRFGTRGDGWTVALGTPSFERSFDVDEVYGGHGPGAVIVATESADGAALQRTLLPVAWAAAAQGNSGDPGEWVAANDEPWFGGRFPSLWPFSNANPEASSFDFRCAGCHSTGARLTGQVLPPPAVLESVSSAPIERAIGCEACHGDGRRHLNTGADRVVNIVNPARMEGRRQVEVCARCHGSVGSAEHFLGDDIPGWAIDADLRLPQPDDAAAWVWERDTFAAVPASKVLADQAGELLASPHHQGELGYVGSCSDCHLPHGSEHPDDLRRDPLDPTLCTDCHRDLRPTAAQREHTHHRNFQPGLWSPGACVTCHMARTAPVVRRDALSGVGELRAHTMAVFDPNDILADFDAAGTDQLGPGEVAVSACMDCHIQAAEDFPNGFTGPLGDPYYRVTYINLARIQDRLWGAE